ncbi:(-)-germacrene D synthase-like isoform X2 [Arachis ipaensis]|uniref:(-)-germacrene D synthase-like isoform X2 n=1 Tax=Arachis ipaensis TaxID=130454 RepID=UPI000A2B28A5|nr:(-)-germacrene D synthase-like isoform X2 [Arachis ipaensis]
MSLEAASIPVLIITTQDSTSSNLKRSYTNFAPSIWHDTFLHYADPQSLEINEILKEKVQVHKEKVKMYLSSNDNISQKLNIIDSIQCLGLSYHFEREIDEILAQIHFHFTNNSLGTKQSSLYFLALFFRLLRQNGYHVSSDIFNKFIKNNEGKFNEIITQDVEGMWSLYEATQLRVHGENILEEAHNYTYTNLKSITNQLSQSLAEQTNRSLKQPLHKAVPRIGARSYMSFYEEDPSHSKFLLTFARLDFNLLQKLHQQELGNITKWDSSCIASLPECMRVVFNAIIELFVEIESLIIDSGKSNLVLQHVKQAFSNMAHGYMVEAKWCDEGYIPTYDEYKVNGILTSVYPFLVTTFIALGEFATKEMFDWVFNVPIILKAATFICRLTNDLASHKFEQQRKHVASAVECCMEQYDISQEQAYEVINKEISNCWKDVNEAYLNSHDIPKHVLDSIVNLARISEFMYENFEDKYTNNELLKNYVATLFLDPIVI